MSKKYIDVAICYDFDGTLSPKNMQEYDFFNALGNGAKNSGQNPKHWLWRIMLMEYWHI